MDIKILDSWLRDYLNTSAKPAEIAKYVSLCGPSFERVVKTGDDHIYQIEVTTNRIDSASVYGIAREAAAILPRFGIPAKIKNLESKIKNNYNFVRRVDYLNAVVDPNLCPRFTAVLIKNIKIEKSPEWMEKRLESAGVRPLNNVIDISNYIMLELGQPVHTFDYDKIAGAKMTLRESRKGEEIETLDGKKFTLQGGDIVIEDAERNLIDLCGIMGGEASAIDEGTENVLLFVQTYNPVNIRKTSMALSQRTQAATIFEKGTDEELVAPAIIATIELFEKLTKGHVSKDIFDIYPKPYRTSNIKISLEYIIARLGVEINKKDVTNYLLSLGFECAWKGNILDVKVPSWRAKDVKGEEDVLEEIARIYGYHNLPSKIMTGEIPERPEDSRFYFERKVKNIISGFGGTEVYTLALVPGSFVDEKNLKLKNPLGPETEYLRTSLLPSLKISAKENVGTVDKFHLFEMANIYLPRNNDLPEERMMLAGIFTGYSYREAKGVIEGILERLNIKYSFKSQESKGFDASKCAFIYSKGELIGKIGYIEGSKLIYYEFEILKLIEASPEVVSFKPILKYPTQNEDITLHIPQHTHIIDVITFIAALNKRIEEVGFVGEYNGNYTFHIKYHDSGKTLTDKEVEEIRKEIISKVKTKFGASVKD